MRALPQTAALFLAAFVAGAAGAQTAPDCAWVAAGGSPSLAAASCEADQKTCAVALNRCLQDFDFAASENWWLFTAQDGLGRNAPVPIHINHQTPQHGLFLSVYVNRIARDALAPLLQQAPAPARVSLPDGAVIAKVNYTDRAEYDASVAAFADPPPPATNPNRKRWLTVMTKIDGFCLENTGGTCNGGNWFYFLSRFGGFLSFEDVYGVQPDGAPIRGAGTAALGQPSAFCTDCHNPVEETDFLWTLDAAFWNTQAPTIAAGPPRSMYSGLTPADTCADGTVEIAPTLPPDVPADPAQIIARSPDDPAAARRQVQAMFDCFSWKSFVSLNWAADPAMRGQPDAAAAFPALGSQRVWESYKETFEVFRPEDPDWVVDTGSFNAPAALPAACRTTLDALDQDARADLSVPKALQMVSKTRANQVLNETHQAFGNQFNVLIDQNGELIRYEVRFNQDEFDYLAETGFANTGAYSYAGPLDGSTVFFPTNATGSTGAGAIEIKAAWRKLDPATDPVERYYARKALRYIPPIGSTAASCEVELVGLIGLHLIRKTETAPQWIWATFEHVDNVPPAAANAPAAPPPGGYTLYGLEQCGPGAPNLPTEAQCASQRPGVLPAANPFGLKPPIRAACCANLQLLANAAPSILGANVRSSASGASAPALTPNQVTRLDPMGAADVNAAVVDAIAALPLPDGGPNPFQFYRLVNTQWPMTPRDANGNIHTLSCFQRDAVGRTDAGCYTILPQKTVPGRDTPVSLRLRNTSMETFQVSTDGPAASDPSHFSSAGCLNCHGDAGVDFSFVFTDGEEILSPVGPEN